MRISSAARDTASAVLMLLLILGLRLVSPETAGLSYVVLAAYALAGRLHALRALGVSFVLTTISEGVAPQAAGGSVGRYLVIVAAALSILMWRRKNEGEAPAAKAPRVTLVIGLLLIIHSVIVSTIVDVSVLKAGTWAMTAAVLLAAWGGLTEEGRRRAEVEFFGGLVAVLLVSVPLLWTDVGFLRNGTGFQGITNQPQTFGTAMAVLAAWSGARFLADRDAAWRLAAVFGGAVSMIVLSEARTAALSLAGALFAAVPLAMLGTRRVLGDLLPALRRRRAHVLVTLGGVALLALGPAISDRVRGFLQKRDDAGSAGSVVEVYGASRGRLIDEMLANIREHPIEGIGFGVASRPGSMVVERDAVLGLPTSGAVEKGVMPLAILEETGVFGAAMLAGWIVFAGMRAARGGLVTSAVLLTALFTNMGEATLFSPGGLGLMVLSAVAWSANGSDPAYQGREEAKVRSRNSRATVA